MAGPRQHTLEVFKQLARHSAVAYRVSDALCAGRAIGVMDAREWCHAACLPQAQSAAMAAFLQAGIGLGLFEKVSERTWRTLDVETLKDMRDLMHGAYLYISELHEDADRVEVVLSVPPNSCKVTEELESQLRGRWGLLDTREMLPVIAEAAQHRLVILSPFVDEEGVAMLLRLFRGTKEGVRRQLIIRKEKGVSWPVHFLAAKMAFDAMGVESYGYWLEREGPGNETFHAKVVLADDAIAYIGSSNMTHWSFNYSLELGLKVSGQAAGRLGDVVDAIINVSERL